MKRITYIRADDGVAVVVVVGGGAHRCLDLQVYASTDRRVAEFR